MYHARKLIVVAVACAAALLATPAAQADPIPGGKIYSTGGEVTLKLLPPDAGYTSEIRLYLVDPLTDEFVTTSKSSTSDPYPLGNIAAGQEVLFGIKVLATGYLFLMGEASRNPDNVIHATTEWTGPNTVKVRFEDLHNKVSDHDYNDVVFEVSGAIAAAPAPAGLALMAIGGLGFGAARFVRRKKVEMV